MTVEAIIDTIALAQPGDVILIPAGQYSSSTIGNVISITKPLTLIGDGMQHVTISCDFHIKDENMTGKAFTASNLTINGIVQINDMPGDVTFLSVAVQCPKERTGSNAFALSNCIGKVLLTCCEIIGGSDGLFLTGSPKVHIHETDIQLARARGIFANNHFIIEDSAVYNCGGYGIKGRVGWAEKGHNEIQSGPWSSFGF